jgi:hypothetical protein
MTESEWLACNEPRPMLEFLRDRTSERKLRLFACACARNVWLKLCKDSRKAVRAVEDFLDGEIKAGTLRNATRRSRDEAIQGAVWSPDFNVGIDLATAVILGLEACVHVHLTWPRHSHFPSIGARRSHERRRQTVLLRELVGNPFRPASLYPTGNLMKGSTVVKLAEAIHADRDFERMPVLADALEDAGCTDGDILDHLRGPGPHVRGCWVIDLLLGKK